MKYFAREIICFDPVKGKKNHTQMELALQKFQTPVHVRDSCNSLGQTV